MFLLSCAISPPFTRRFSRNDSSMGDECLGLIKKLLGIKERDMEDDLIDDFRKENLRLDESKLYPR